jgi:hypothetical protein
MLWKIAFRSSIVIVASSMLYYLHEAIMVWEPGEPLTKPWPFGIYIALIAFWAIIYAITPDKWWNG